MQRYYILLKATGESGLPAWLPYRLTATSAELAVEKAKKMAEDLGIKLGDFMMPIRMAVTGSRVSPPLMGSILILGVEKSIERIERTLKSF